MAPLRGLYVITPDPGNRNSDCTLTDDALLNSLNRAIAGGATLVQLRDKRSSGPEKIALARQMLSLCRSSGIPLIINDDVSLALIVGADGVHLGQDDETLSAARQRLGTNAIIGVSCYNQLDMARQAERQGANYVAFGRFYASQTKPDAVLAPLDLLRTARQQLTIPIAAIGGINAENAGTLIEAGASMLAVVDSVFGQADITDAANKISCYFA